MNERIMSENIQNLATQIMEWKNKYNSIYYLKIGKLEYIFRLLTKGEYLALYFVQFHVSEKAEDVLLEKCVLYPILSEEYVNNLYAGDVGTLVDKILGLSGFSTLENIKSDLDKEREKMSLLDNQIVLIICKAFPHITPTDINSFDYPTIIHYVTLAEELLGTKLEITTPEDQTKIDFESENRKQGFVGNAAPPPHQRPPPSKKPRR